MTLPKGHKGNVQPTGDPVEDARRFSHPMTTPEDGRSIVNFDKVERLERFWNGELDQNDVEILKSQKYTNKEKATLLRDPRFKDIVDARLFDMILGLCAFTREQDRIFLTIMKRLGMISNSAMGGIKLVNQPVKIGRIEVTTRKPNPDGIEYRKRTVRG